ncbi:prolyl oligopeptidase family serine peptidase [Aquimarina pacifica]|uniref:prolyl oligopeptidase family serine peptidase n=1 Tax=Aquimarina pacifica TaxID=1296415 RepID=UPI0004B77551|nr:prolyl oligopeptidase family serine peptidase [Aquimarina pacifica]
MLSSNIVIDQYHGVNIEDPYRHVEDLTTPEIKNWIDEQNVKSTNSLHNIKKRQYLIDKQFEYDKNKSYVISKLKVTENNKYFYLKRLPNENISRLYFRDSFEDEEHMLYNPKTFREESKVEHTINYIQPNWDGSKIVISLTSKGKEISEMIILDVSSKEIHPDIISNAWPSSTGGVVWLPNNSEFIYLHHDVVDPKLEGFLKNTTSVVYSLQNSANESKAIFSKKNNSNIEINEEDHPIVTFSNSKNEFLIGKVSGGLSYYDAYSLPIDQISTNNWAPLFKKSDEVKSFIVKGDSLIYKTAKGAPNFKICSTSIKDPDFENPKVIVEEFNDRVITDFDSTNEGIYFVTTKNGVEASLYTLEKSMPIKIELPASFGNITIKAKGCEYEELWIMASGWTTKKVRYEYKKGQIIKKSLDSADNTKGFNVEDIIVEEIEVKAHDGEKIPLSVIYKKGTERNGKTPLMMDSYGSFGLSMTPSFSLRRFLWIQEGGVYAIAHVRGGGEKGDAWHKGGYKASKPNTWKDFISCAEYLIEKKYTDPKQLAVWSGSAGGILIGRAITDRPDLFSAAIIEFGTLNLIRSIDDANGANIAKEFGSIKDSLEFRGLLEMDAYHHIKEKENYPATLLTAGLNDPRVPAWNSVKFGARILAANTSGKPNFLLVDSETGHARDDTKLKEFERYANILAFALWQTGHPEYQPKQN